MTLLVGIKCDNGIVMAADGAATYGSMGDMTIRQPTRKLGIVGDRIVIGTSGPVGLGQLIRQRVKNLWDENRFSRAACPDAAQAMRLLREELWKDIYPAIQQAKAAANILGSQVASSSAVCFSLIALPISGLPTLIQLDQQCSPEEASADLPFVALGSGQKVADPFLAFLRRIFWPGELPSIADGIFAATWALDHSIAIAPGFIAEPVEVAVLEKQGTNVEARVLEDDELGEHRENIAAAEDHLADYRHRTSPNEVSEEEVPEVPE